MKEEKVYLGLGGNLGDPLKTLQMAVLEIRAMPGVSNVKVSRFYKTSPVGGFAQKDYINAVCSLTTSLEPTDLHCQLRALEDSFGARSPIKNSPRYLDIDILLFGRRIVHDERGLRIPHPRWMERLFVLTPFFDLVNEVDVPDANSSEGVVTIDLKRYLETFPNPNNETVVPLTGESDEKCSY